MNNFQVLCSAFFFTHGRHTARPINSLESELDKWPLQFYQHSCSSSDILAWAREQEWYTDIPGPAWPGTYAAFFKDLQTHTPGHQNLVWCLCLALCKVLSCYHVRVLRMCPQVTAKMRRHAHMQVILGYAGLIDRRKLPEVSLSCGIVWWEMCQMLLLSSPLIACRTRGW